MVFLFERRQSKCWPSYWSNLRHDFWLNGIHSTSMSIVIGGVFFTKVHCKNTHYSSNFFVKWLNLRFPRSLNAGKIYTGKSDGETRRNLFYQTQRKYHNETDTCWTARKSKTKRIMSCLANNVRFNRRSDGQRRFRVTRSEPYDPRAVYSRQKYVFRRRFFRSKQLRFCRGLKKKKKKRYLSSPRVKTPTASRRDGNNNNNDVIF